MESLRTKAKCAREQGKESQLLQPERYYRPHQAAVPLKADKRCNRSTTAQASVIERGKAGAAPVYPRNSHLTGTTAPSTGTTAEHIRKHLQEPVPEHPAVQLPP